MKTIILHTISKSFLHRDQISLGTDILYEYINLIDKDIDNKNIYMYKIYKEFNEKPLKAFKLTVKKILDDIYNFNPNILFISVEYGAVNLVKYIINKLYKKGLTNTLFVVGGLSVNFIYNDIITNCNNTIAGVGEGEVSLKEIIDKYKIYDINDLKQYSTINNVIIYNKSTKQNSHGNIVRSEISRDFPYIKPVVHNFRKFHDIEMSRGCPHAKCTFCVVPYQFTGCDLNVKSNSSWKGYEINNIIKRIKYLIDNGVTKFSITDSDVVGPNTIENIQRLIDISSEIIKIKNTTERNITFDAVCMPVSTVFNFKDSDRLMNLKREMFLNLKEMGVKGIYIGLESGSEHQLKIYNKISTDVNQSKLAVKLLENYNFNSTSYGFMFFDYLSDMDVLIDNIKFVEDLKLWNTLTNISKSLIVYKYTKYYEIVKYMNLLRERNKKSILEYNCEYLYPEVKYIVNIKDIFINSSLQLERLVDKEHRIEIYYQNFLFLKDLIYKVKNNDYNSKNLIKYYMDLRKDFINNLLKDDTYKNNTEALFYLNKYINLKI